METERKVQEFVFPLRNGETGSLKVPHPIGAKNFDILAGIIMAMHAPLSDIVYPSTEQSQNLERYANSVMRLSFEAAIREIKRVKQGIQLLASKGDDEDEPFDDSYWQGQKDMLDDVMGILGTGPEIQIQEAEAAVPTAEGGG